MVKIFLALTIFLFSNTTISQTGKTNNYTLTITKGIAKKENGNTYWIIPTTLTNHSKDTLKYFSMSCSWQEFYSVNNRKLQIEFSKCDKNVPTVLTLAPGQKKTVEIRLLISQTMDTPEIRFKIGYNLIKVINKQNPLNFNFNEAKKRGNVIWSNTISM